MPKKKLERPRQELNSPLRGNALSMRTKCNLPIRIRKSIKMNMQTSKHLKDHRIKQRRYSPKRLEYTHRTMPEPQFIVVNVDIVFHLS